MFRFMGNEGVRVGDYFWGDWYFLGKLANLKRFRLWKAVKLHFRHWKALNLHFRHWKVVKLHIRHCRAVNLTFQALEGCEK